jgi:hypothetical protein
MNRPPALAVLLITTFLLAACGGQSDQAPDPEEGQTDPTTGESVAETTQEESAPPESTESESSAPEGEQGGQAEASGYSVTTLEGEQVSLGGGDEVTALFFMAGW